MSKTQNIETLQYLQKLPVSSLAKKQNIMRLARAFNKYFLTVTSTLDGAMWYDCRFYVEQNIPNIRKWNISDIKTIINIMENMESDIISPWDNGKIPAFFLNQDNRSRNSGGVSKGISPFLQELSSAGSNNAVQNILRPKPPVAFTHGTATEYIALFRQIKDYYKSQALSK